MDLILNILREISIETNIKIFAVGKYIANKLIGIANKNIDIVIKDEFQYVTDLLFNRIAKYDLLLEKADNFAIIINKDKKITVNLSPMQNSLIEEELKNRYYTIDSMAVDITQISQTSNKMIIDPFNGLKDIDAKIIRHTVSDFVQAEPINILKAVSLIAEYDFQLDEESKRHINQNRELLKRVARKDLADELFKIFRFKKTNYYLKYMCEELNILELIFPEIKAMRDIGECKYHVVNALMHSFYTVEILEDIIYSDGYFEEHIKEVYEAHSMEEIVVGRNRLEYMKLGAFFHDIGKPSAMKIDETGRTRFRGHEKTGGEIIKKIAQRLQFSSKEIELMYRLVSKHMVPLILYKKNDVSGKALYEMFDELNEDTLDVLLIALADIIATRKLLNPSEEMGKFKIYIEYMANNYLTRFKEK